MSEKTFTAMTNEKFIVLKKSMVDGILECNHKNASELIAVYVAILSWGNPLSKKDDMLFMNRQLSMTKTTVKDCLETLQEIQETYHC